MHTHKYIYTIFRFALSLVTLVGPSSVCVCVSVQTTHLIWWRSMEPAAVAGLYTGSPDAVAYLTTQQYQTVDVILRISPFDEIDCKGVDSLTLEHSRRSRSSWYNACQRRW